MAPKNINTEASTRKLVMNKGAWTAEEDQKLAQYIEVHGSKRWKTVALRAGLNRCGKSCRLRWLNYLRPNIKRGNISDEEEDLILRLHKLLGNRWSLIAGRLPGRTDNEIKNYWNSHLSKKINKEKMPESSNPQETISQKSCDTTNNTTNTITTTPPQVVGMEEDSKVGAVISELNFDFNDFFDFSNEGFYGLEWVKKFLELDEEPWLISKSCDL